MPLESMQKLIKEQVNMSLNIVKVFLSLLFLLQVGCSTLTPAVKSEKFSCEEEAPPKSLEFLEQQYRCTSSE